MNNLKSFVTTLIIVAFSCTGYSQTKELGLRLGNLTDFTFIYKKEKSDNKFFRHRLGSFNLNVLRLSDDDRVLFGMGYAFGIEKRKNINEKLKFVHGIEPQLAVGINSLQGITIISISPAIGYVLGFQYDINDDFYVSLETIPSIGMNANLVDEGDNLYNFSAGFNSNAVALTIAYRFNSTAK